MAYCNLRDNELQRYSEEVHSGGSDTITSISDVSLFYSFRILWYFIPSYFEYFILDPWHTYGPK